MQDEKSGRAPAGPVSMAQVARVAGVSQQTVSRVANGLPNVSERTRERVLLAMEELGFRPNFAGRPGCASCAGSPCRSGWAGYPL